MFHSYIHKTRQYNPAFSLQLDSASKCSGRSVSLPRRAFIAALDATGQVAPAGSFAVIRTVRFKFRGLLGL